MICIHCGRFIKDGSLTCEHCGTYLGKFSGQKAKEGSTRAIRQGRTGSIPHRITDHRDEAPIAIGDYDLSAAPSEAARPNGSVRPEGPDRNSNRYPSLDSLPPRPLQNVAKKKSRLKATRHSKVNWAVILTILLVLAIGGFAGYKIYMKKTDEGQLITARKYILSTTEADFELANSSPFDIVTQDAQKALLEKWEEVSPDAYWNAGRDFLSYGDINAAITAFRIGDNINPENYDGLLLLANAYELNAEDDKAEKIYIRLIKEVRADRSDAYSALVSLYRIQGREQEAADLLQDAYTNTGRETFRLLRSDFIPSMPKVDLAAGRYEMNENGLRSLRINKNGKPEVVNQITISSEQGFDIYYTLDDQAKLPEEGIMVERILDEEGNLGYAGLKVQEGTVTIRAVAVSGSLSSDEFRASYVFYYPTPPAPYVNLAPNTYTTLHSVMLRPGINTDDTLKKAELAERESHYVYYYTIDGSTPTTNSPQFTGTPIPLPSGRVTFKAICINQYGKESSVLEVGYKFEVKPYLPAVYEETDIFGDFVLNKTTLEEFTDRFGKPKRQVDTNYYNLAYSTTHLDYPWGHAVFMLNGNIWQLVRVEMNQNITDGPRKTRISMSEKELTDTFRDYGQPDNADGTRGLYYSYPSVGQILFKEDGTRVVQYQLQTAASKLWRLEYTIRDGRVVRITHFYVP